MEKLNEVIKQRIISGVDINQQVEELRLKSAMRNDIFQTVSNFLKSEERLEKPFVNIDDVLVLLNRVKYLEESYDLKSMNNAISTFHKHILCLRAKMLEESLGHEEILRIRYKIDQYLADYTAFYKAMYLMFGDDVLSPNEIERLILEKDNAKGDFIKERNWHYKKQNIYDISAVSYKVLNNYEDLLWVAKKFDINSALAEEATNVFMKDPFYFKEALSIVFGASIYLASWNPMIPYSVVSNLMREECGALGTITTKVGEMFGYEHFEAKNIVMKLLEQILSFLQ